MPPPDPAARPSTRTSFWRERQVPAAMRPETCFVVTSVIRKPLRSALDPIVHVGDTGLPLEHPGTLELDLLWSEALEQTAPLAEEHRDDVQLELVEDAGGKGEPRDSHFVDEHVLVARSLLDLGNLRCGQLLTAGSPPYSCRRAEARWIDSLLEGRKRRSVSQPLDLAIVAHCVDVDPEKIPHSSRDSEGGRFRTGRDHDRKPCIGVADFLGGHSPQ